MHIHIPDGVLPIWLWLTGFLVTSILLVIVLPKLKKEIKKIPMVGMMTAVALLVMSIPLGLPVHLNLMVLIGLIVGVRWSLVVALTVNFILASFGHGGLTIVGLNTLLLWLQATAGIFLFRFFIKFFKNYFASASIVTFISLFLSFLLLVGIVAVSQVDPRNFLSHKHEHQAVETAYHENHESEVNTEKIKKETEHAREEETLAHTKISLITFTILSLPIFLLGAVVESLVTGFVVQFVRRVKPELIIKSLKH
ncbi:MAG: energy-coupling factor ABC transporter permease [Patescibacteria group bacterium]